MIAVEWDERIVRFMRDFLDDMRSREDTNRSKDLERSHDIQGLISVEKCLYISRVISCNFSGKENVCNTIPMRSVVFRF